MRRKAVPETCQDIFATDSFWNESIIHGEAPPDGTTASHRSLRRVNDLVTVLVKASPLPSDTAIRRILADRIDKHRQSVGIVVGIIEPKRSESRLVRTADS
jgi:hypothetical protein